MGGWLESESNVRWGRDSDSASKDRRFASQMCGGDHNGRSIKTGLRTGLTMAELRIESQFNTLVGFARAGLPLPVAQRVRSAASTRTGWPPFTSMSFTVPLAGTNMSACTTPWSLMERARLGYH